MKQSSVRESGGFEIAWVRDSWAPVYNSLKLHFSSVLKKTWNDSPGRSRNVSFYNSVRG